MRALPAIAAANKGEQRDPPRGWMPPTSDAAGQVAAASSAAARPAGAARSAGARAGAADAERCWSHASWSCELLHHAGGVKLRRGGLLTASNFSWSWMCRSLEETRLEVKTKISAVVRTEEVRGLVSVVVSVE